jgi:hypothetical protein
VTRHVKVHVTGDRGPWRRAEHSTAAEVMVQVERAGETRLIRGVRRGDISALLEARELADEVAVALNRHEP